ncbi:MAG: S-adenosyl-l-methionine hydroxide adenosyltransferase family protein [Candidatus Aminicenantia bacterium]
MKKKILLSIILFFLFIVCSHQPKEETIPSNAVIALLTDWGDRDFYSGAAKGIILSINPQVKILDISHNIHSFDIKQASAQLFFSSKEFPEGTIFVADVDPGSGLSRAILIETENNKYFIGPDNGIFTLIYESFGIKRIIHLTNKKYMMKGDLSFTFHGRDIFAPVAAYLSKRIPIEKFGKELQDPVKFKVNKARIENETIYGEILLIDSYGNIITNISQKLLKKLNIRLGDRIKLKIGSNKLEVRFVNTYAEGRSGEFICLISSTKNLEIAVNLGRVTDYFSTFIGDSVEIRKAK